MLAACADVQEPPTAPLSDTSATQQAPTQKTAAQSAPHQIGPPAQAPVREAVRAAPEPSPKPEVLIGLAPDAVDDLLGPPDLVRKDGPAEVRLYRNPQTACTFHVFLYVDDLEPQTKTVEYYEARDRSGRLEGTELANCYGGLVKPAATS